mmetsp:Transcript_140700/g.448787  ORF Transcript_140700/g.448787 Transcript_140700/m.448787 type:complete len:181 (-) Transcript_140700:302-844(-)|eukprot:CAMPEP_0203922208 /NCGR_PEP_ID=MMETSP0359-20131031/62274_1 /ASSEMBLY_ACC=CAM_ASM_000338 /TAXON_ID=268821 /ORGANISM="Scrippsiella Hangoei, Strain SHTV-5" /LENGTH=180 /DNA_ID=CAMNT_0050850047 /DNA_START=25 /DNA_END=567 /DNA_ORIENTATION=-
MADPATAAGPAAVDFEGTWHRNAGRSAGVAEALVARGHPREVADERSAAPYIQRWERTEGGDVGVWTVTTFKTDGVTPRRTLVYPLGDWEEEYEGASTLFGGATTSPGEPQRQTVPRHTSWESEPQAVGGLAHVTTSATLLGHEESRRFLADDGSMVLRRMYRETGSEEAAVSDEVFERQ